MKTDNVRVITKIKINCPCCSKSISFRLYASDIYYGPSLNRCPKCQKFYMLWITNLAIQIRTQQQEIGIPETKVNFVEKCMTKGRYYNSKER